MNTNTNSIVFTSDTAWISGKFLINCLGLSNGAVLQDTALAEQQLDGMLTPEMKFNELMSRLDNVGSQWLDLGLGCALLFGDDLNNPDRHVIDRLSNSDKLFFLVRNNLAELERGLGNWTNPKLIMFINETDFARWGWGNVDNVLFTERLPAHLTHMTPDHVLDVIINQSVVENQNNQLFEKLVPNSFTWDCDDYLDKSKFLVSMRNCYEFLNLTDFDENLIGPFYDKYMATLDKLRLP
jgi:hypothetical protein